MVQRCMVVAFAACCLSMVSCAEKTKQMVVPTSGAWLAEREARQEAVRTRLMAEFPGLKPDVVDAIFSISRARFVTRTVRHRAYDDKMLPIGSGQATLRLSDIGFVLSQIDLRPTDDVLEIGTGTGYLAAVMSRMVRHVYSVEIIEYLAELARQSCEQLSLDNVRIRTADGHEGWARYAPYDVIWVTAAVREIPAAYETQIKPGGRLAIPIMDESGKAAWVIYTRTDGAWVEKSRRETPVGAMIEAGPVRSGGQSLGGAY